MLRLAVARLPDQASEGAEALVLAIHCRSNRTDPGGVADINNHPLTGTLTAANCFCATL